MLPGRNLGMRHSAHRNSAPVHTALLNSQKPFNKSNPSLSAKKERIGKTDQKPVSFPLQRGIFAIS